MPSFATQVPDLRGPGPLLQIQLVVPPAVDTLLKQASRPVHALIQIMAMIDTGASHSVVQAGLLTQLGLQPIGVVPINTPSSTNVQCYEYAARMLLSNASITVDGTFIEAPLQNQHIQCLIGRDILAHGVFVYVGYSNLFSLSF